jgi:hypothetical protein
VNGYSGSSIQNSKQPQNQVLVLRSIYFSSQKSLQNDIGHVIKGKSAGKRRGREREREKEST